MSRTALPEPAELDAALTELADGKFYRLAAYARKNGIPALAGERFALALLEAHAKPCSAGERIAYAVRYYNEHLERDGGRKAHADACHKFGIKRPGILDNALRGVRPDVNRLLKKI
jgi:hypothetical protein